jgi:integrase
MKPLEISKKNRVKGLFTFCLKCKTSTGNGKCGDSKKSLQSCEFQEKHCFRTIITVPNTNGKKRKTKVFVTRNLNEAIKLKLDFEKDLLDNNFQNNQYVAPTVKRKSNFLEDYMNNYLDFLNNINLQDYQVKKRSIGHINDVKRAFKFLNESLKLKKIDASILLFEDLNENIVGIFHNYLLKNKNYSNKTYNNNIGLIRHFVSWVISTKQYNFSNPFIGVSRRKVMQNNLTITSVEFSSLLSFIVPGNGYLIHKNGKRRNFYRKWMKNAFILALETGLRREEFLRLKYIDIQFDDKKNPVLIKVENYKVNRILRNESGEKRYKYVPITLGLLQLLKSLNYKEKINSESFLIGEEESASRETLILVVSKAFSHFWSFTGIQKDLKLKHLRKTYLTSLVEHFGDKAGVISDHSDINVLKNHYVNKQQLITAIKIFKVFDEEE